MEYHLLEKFDKLLNRYYELLKNPDTTNVDAIMRSIEEEKKQMEKLMVIFKKRDDKLNEPKKETQRKNVFLWKGIYVNQFGKMIYGWWLRI